MTTKTIDQLCARDIGKRVRYTSSDGAIVEGPLGYVKQYERGPRFAIFKRIGIFEIEVAGYRLAGLTACTEVEFR